MKKKIDNTILLLTAIMAVFIIITGLIAALVASIPEETAIPFVAIGSTLLAGDSLTSSFISKA